MYYRFAAISFLLAVTSTIVALRSGLLRVDTFIATQDLSVSPFSTLLCILLFSFPATVLFTILIALIVDEPIRYRMLLGFNALAMLAVLTVIEIAGKRDLPQPAATDLAKEYVLGIHLPYTYPSGHAMRTAFLCCLALPYLRAHFKAGSVAVLLFMLWIVVVSGMHFASDVIIGMLLGLAGASFVNAFSLHLKDARETSQYENSGVQVHVARTSGPVGCEMYEY